MCYSIKVSLSTNKSLSSGGDVCSDQRRGTLITITVTTKHVNQLEVYFTDNFYTLEILKQNSDHIMVFWKLCSLVLLYAIHCIVPHRTQTSKLIPILGSDMPASGLSLLAAVLHCQGKTFMETVCSVSLPHLRAAWPCQPFFRECKQRRIIR